MEKAIKYGIPVLVAIVLFLQLKNSHGKASGSADGISVLISLFAWAVFFVGLLIAGLIGWYGYQKSHLILSFCFSIAAFLAVFFIVPPQLYENKNKKTVPEVKSNLESKHNKQRAKEAALIDSLMKEYEADPNNLGASESLGIFFASKVEYAKALTYLEKAVENNSKKDIVYCKLADLYWWYRDFDKVESFNSKVLQLEVDGKLVFEKHQHEKFVTQLEEARKAKGK